MTDDEIRKAFSGGPLGAGILMVAGYGFMLTRASNVEIALFTCGILMVVLGIGLIAHVVRGGRWYTILPSMLFGISSAFVGVFLAIVSMVPHLP